MAASDTHDQRGNGTRPDPVPPATSSHLGCVAVVGLGYVGLPTSISFARAGFSVIGLDVNPQRIDDICQSEVDVLPRDRAALRAALECGQIRLSTEASSLREADAIIICVPTPVDEHRVPVFDAIECACSCVVANVRAGQTVILTSTSFAGTTRRFLIDPLTAAGWHIGLDLFVAFAPERIDPANAAFTQEAVPRIVGGTSSWCAERAHSFLAHVASSVHVVSSPEVAELTKLFENTFRAVNIALANELAEICDALGISPVDVVDAASTKPYGFMPFYPGPGVGGHCIPVDPHYLLWHTRSMDVPTPVIEQAMNQIAARPHRVVERVARVLSDAHRGVNGANILVVGAAYKPGVADLRGSPALPIIDDLTRRGAEVFVFDPIACPTASRWSVADDPASTIDSYDLVVVHTVHPSVDYSWLSRAQLLLDCTYRCGATGRGPYIDLTVEGAHHAVSYAVAALAE